MLTRIHSFGLTLVFYLLILLPVSAQSFKGKWQGISEGEVGMMSFDKKGFVSFLIDGKPMGGKKFTSEGVDLSMRYEYNEKVTPHTLDFIISTSDEGMELIRMLGIYQFIDASTLMVNMNFQGIDRPAEFNENDKNQVVLKKVK